jgi:Domain of unknown function (DUF4062)
MEKRYQVFVSSTFTDLTDERRAVMQALLELKCIRAGMELFPASTDDQWTLIQRVIDDCDYYLVLVGGRYGSMDAQGISFTEKEYDYALQQGKFVMGFLHRNPDDIPVGKSERDPATTAKLDAFRSKVQQRMCKHWSNADELGGVVSRSYIRLLETHPTEGWIKSRYAKTTEDLEKINQMHEQIRILEQEIARLREIGESVPANLARGADVVKIGYFSGGEKHPIDVGTVESTWNDIFLVVGQACMNLPPEWQVQSCIKQWLSDLAQSKVVKIAGPSFQKVKIQFYALGLIRMEMLMRPGAGNNPPQPRLGWVLTEAGRGALAELLAEKRHDV